MTSEILEARLRRFGQGRSPDPDVAALERRIADMLATGETAGAARLRAQLPPARQRAVSQPSVAATTPRTQVGLTPQQRLGELGREPRGTLGQTTLDKLRERLLASDVARTGRPRTLTTPIVETVSGMLQPIDTSRPESALFATPPGAIGGAAFAGVRPTLMAPRSALGKPAAAAAARVGAPKAALRIMGKPLLAGGAEKPIAKIVSREITPVVGNRIVTVTVNGQSIIVKTRAGRKGEGLSDFGDKYPVEETRAAQIKQKAIEKWQARQAEIARGQAEMPIAAAKTPWQMTREQYALEQSKRSALSGGVARPNVRGRNEAESYMNWWRARHKDRVGEALAAGKPVPPSVLADYPDLAKAAPKAPATKTGLFTLTGRQLESPKLTTIKSNISARNNIRRVDAWLVDAAKTEAKLKGDTWNFEQFDRIVPAKITAAERDGLNLYLFGQEEVPLSGFRPKPLAPVAAAKPPVTEAAEVVAPKVPAPRSVPPRPRKPVPAALPKTIRPEPAPPPPSPAAGQALPPSPAPAAPPPVPPKPPLAQAVVPPEEPFAANIRLTKYPEDVRSPIKEWAEANPEAVQAARRGVRSDALVLADAKELVEEIGGNFAKIQKRWKPGQAWNAEEITAIRGTLRAKSEAVLDAAKVARADNSAANHAKFLVASQEMAQVQQLVHGVTAEAGRSLRAFRQEAFDAIKANDNVRLEELLRRIGDRRKLDDVVAAASQLDLANPIAVNEFIRKMNKPSLWDYVMEFYINSILSGPKTHIINEGTNLALTATSPVERFIAAGVEQVLAPLQRRQVERFFAEAPADAIGALQGINEGVRAALSTLKNGITPSAASKWEFRRTAFRGKFGRIIRGPGTLLEAADAMNYVPNYRAALNASIVRQARKEGLRGQALEERIAALKMQPTEKLVKEAAATAEYRLFRGESKLADALLGIRAKYPALRFVVPFVRTPINITKFGLERSPLGVVNPSLWRNRAIKSPELSDQIARILLGSSISALIALKIAEGRITGAAPTNAAERDRFYREGKLPYSVQIGDTWVQYQRLEPFNQSLSQVAVAVDALKANDKTALEKVGDAVFTIGQNLVGQPYLTGLNDFMNMLFQPERYGARWVSRLLGAGVPFSSAMRTAAQTFDPTFRRPGTLGESLQVGIPGLSQNVPAVITAFGEEAPRTSPAWSPIQVTPAQQSFIDAELERVGVEVGFVGKTIGGIELTREEQEQYRRLAGQVTKAGLARLITSDHYGKLNDLDKEAAIERVVNFSREQARATMAGEPMKGTAEEHEAAVEVLQPYWGMGEEYAIADLGKNQAAWADYLDPPKGKTAATVLKANPSLKSLVKRQARDRERLRRTPEIDLALVRWYGYQGMTAAGKRLYKELYEGGQPTTPVTQPAAPTGATPSPRLKRLREMLAER